MKSYSNHAVKDKFKKPYKKQVSELVVTRIPKVKRDNATKRFHTNESPDEIDVLDDRFYD